jgi:L-lactate dehydrogenase
MEHGFDGILLMTTNPVDILAQAAQERSQLPVSKVISSGTVLDTARLRSMIGEKLGIDARSVHAYIVGEHGDSEIAAWSSATVGGVPLREMAEVSGIDLDAILNDVRRAAPRIVETKGYTSVAIASCVAKICEAILRNENTILPVSTLVTGQYGIEGVYMSLPCVVGRNGVERVIAVPLDDHELEGLKISAEILRKTLGKLRSIPENGYGNE